MKIGILGAGNVGSALGRSFARCGHEVMYGVRDASKPDVVSLVAETGAGAKAGTIAEASQFGEVVVLSVHWGAVRDVLAAAGDLSGKILLDCTNPLKPRLEGLELGLTTSGGETVAEWAPGAKIVKIFNTIGAEIMLDTTFPEGRPAILYCGDDADAKRTAAGLADAIGFEPIDLGPLEQSRYLEPYAMVWIRLAFAQGLGRNFAFRLMRR